MIGFLITILCARAVALNIAETLRRSAEKWPDTQAVIAPVGNPQQSPRPYVCITFAELDARSNAVAAGLQKLGVGPGHRLVLMLRPGLDFITCTYAIFKTGATVVLIDPGMGRGPLLTCLDRVRPDGFVALSIVHAIRTLQRRRFATARFNVTAGRRWFWGGPTLRQLAEPATPVTLQPPDTSDRDPAAIIFTSGSTGTPKGVVYEHGMFARQAEWIRDFYSIQPTERDLPGFPLFALFNAAMGVTTVVPDMDPTRPANVDPRRILAAFSEQHITQAFGSPAIWNRVSRYCQQHRITVSGVKRIMSAGAPVPPTVIERTLSMLADADANMHIPYGATEALPVTSISGRDVLQRTAALTAGGSGTCVGKPFPGIRVKIIAITDGPIANIDSAVELRARNVYDADPATIGEIIVQGPVVTREYFEQPAANAAAKIADGNLFWHRMGDTGYLDEQGDLWFCGRKSHMLWTTLGPMFTDCCEPVYNQHPHVYRTALVGTGPRGSQRPVLIVEPEPGHWPKSNADRLKLANELLQLGSRCATTRRISTFAFHRSLPVDVRHNTKINRELLAVWVTSQPLTTVTTPTDSATTSHSGNSSPVVTRNGAAP